MASNILAIDYGEKHLGIAVSVDRQKPQPLKTIRYKDKFHLVEEIIGIIRAYEAQTILIGETKMNGVNNLIEELQTRIPDAKIKIVDESHTTAQAKKELSESRIPTRIHHKADHAVAALLMLQDYLEHDKI